MATRNQQNKFTLAAAFRAAIKGIVFASKERNFRIDVLFAICTIILGLICQISTIEWVVVIACFGLVLGGETINSAIEAIVDLASPEFHSLAGKAKDCAAGAVLLFALGAFVVGCIIFIPKLLSILFGA